MPLPSPILKYAKRSTARRQVPAGWMRVGTLAPMPQLLAEHRVDPVRFLAEFGLTPEDLADPDNIIRAPVAGLLYERAATATGCPHFGLMMGHRQGAPALGAVGYLMQTAPDVRTALSNLAESFPSHNPNAAVDLLAEGDCAILAFTMLDAELHGLRQMLPGAMALACNFMHHLCGVDWRPVEVRFAHSRPRDLSLFKTVFRSPLRFNQELTALVFDASWLDHPVAAADPLLHMLMARQLSELSLGSEDDIVSRVRQALPGQQALGNATVRGVAAELGLSTRTLNRRLAGAGTSFKALREEWLHALARQLLLNTRLPASVISERLGYANASAFTRAFRRWSSEGPSRWRKAASHRAAPF